MRVLGLTINEREGVLRALEEAGNGLAGLRGTLLRDREWRVAQGLQRITTLAALKELFSANPFL